MRLALLAVGVGFLAVLAMGAARQAQLANDAPDNSTPEDASASDESSPLADAADAINPFSIIQGYTMSGQTQDPNVGAFLGAIRFAEGTDRAPDPYAVCYGYSFTITDFSDHPAALGVWNGVGLDNLGPRYAGLKSTAAGAYQLILPTWRRAKAALGLTDFSAASQDAAATWLIDKRNALDDVKGGDVATAAAKCAPEWASLPGSTAGQGGKSLDQIASAFLNNGGTLA